MRKPHKLITQILAIILIIYIPVIIVSVISLTYSNNNLEDQVISSLKIQQDNSIRFFEHSIKKTYTSSSALLTNKELIRLSSHNPSNYETMISINNLKNELTTLSDANNFIQYIRVYIPDLGLAITSTQSGIGSMEYLDFEDFTEIFSYEEEQNLNFGTPTGKLFKHNAGYSLFIFPKKYEYQNVVELHLDELAITSYFHSEFDMLESNFLLMTSDSNDVVFESMDEEAKEIFSSNDHSTHNKSSLRKYNFLHKNPYYVYSHKLDFLEAMYYFIIPSGSYFERLNNSITFNTFSLTFLLIGTILLVIGINRVIHKPLQELSTSFDIIKTGNFDVQLEPSQITDFNYIYHNFNTMVKDMEFLIQENYQKRVLLQQAQLRQMQAQINPHFLYNSFFMLKQMIRRGMQEESEEVSEQLGHYFRYITKINSDTVSLRDEYDHALNYASIQALRFKARIRVIYDDLPDIFDQLIVPKLILQPLLENAYRHGLEAKTENGFIKMRIHGDASHLIFTIEDNGEQLTKEKLLSLQEKIKDPLNTEDAKITGALMNIAGRLKIFYQVDDLLQLDMTEIGGLLVTLKLPLYQQYNIDETESNDLEK